MGSQSKGLSDKIKAAVGNLPKPARSVPVADPEFVRDLIRSGKAVKRKAGKPLPEDAEYEIIVKNGKCRLVHHRTS